MKDSSRKSLIEGERAVASDSETSSPLFNREQNRKTRKGREESANYTNYAKGREDYN
jgi:hypothetical protein